MLILDARIPGSRDRVDIQIDGGAVTQIHPAGNVTSRTTTSNTVPADEIVHADGRWALPGLWDCHTHFTQWSQTFGRLDLLQATSASHAMQLLSHHLAALRSSGDLDPLVFVVGMRFRHSLWADSEQPTLAAIDEVSGEQPVALSSADMHCGWVNSAAARLLGIAVGPSGLVGERTWFNVYHRLDDAPDAEQRAFGLLKQAQADAASKGVVGIRDYEMADNIPIWEDRFAHGLDLLRVEAGVYPDFLDAAIANGLRTGDPLPGTASSGRTALGTVGAMKLISDGSLNTRSAYCSTPYSGIEPATCGVLNYTPEEITSHFAKATAHGFAIACHAIGDEANSIVLDAAQATHAHGSIEHAQMLKERDIPRLAQLGLEASIQPQHAMDDRDVIGRFWQHPAGKPYAFHDLLTAGTRLRFGSDAPVAPLDPWLAISAAVFMAERSGQEPFQPEQRLDISTALASSTEHGRIRLAPGDAADLVLLDRDPCGIATPEDMRTMPSSVAATMVAGRWTHTTL